MVSEEQKKEGKTKERESKCNQDEMCRTSAAAAITCWAKNYDGNGGADGNRTRKSGPGLRGAEVEMQGIDKHKIVLVVLCGSA